MQAVFQGALGKHRHIRLLAGTDLSKVIYAYGTMDRAVGQLTGEEVAFPESRGAEVIAVEGGHGSMLDEPATAKIVELFEDRGEALARARHLDAVRIERANLSVRMGNRRYSRKTNGFSRKL